MKKIYRSTILLAINICISILWLNGQSTYVILDKPFTGNQLFQATQKITISAGFSYDSKGTNTFNALVAPANGQAYNFTESTDNSVLPTSSIYSVGSIAGGMNVSPTGGATYSIPIKIPPGIGGMAPNISINYNSQSGEDLIGLGWSVSGLSHITRSPSDLYHETYINNIQFNSNDHFALDGQRLILISTSVASTEYRTESEAFSKITAYGPIGDPTYIIVETKDGKAIEFGNTVDSRIEAQGRTEGLVWVVNKISDKSGNNITFTYSENNSTGEYYPLTINYLGNTIQFEYQTRSIPVVSYVSGCMVTLDSLLKNIYIINEGTTINRFKFLYTNSDSRLYQIIEYGKNSSRLNSTIITYGSTNVGLKENPTLSTYSYDNKYNRYPGDFNGDGKEDYVFVNGSTWTLYLSDGSGNFVSTSSGSMPTDYQSVYVGDFDADGKKDLMVVSNLANLYVFNVLIATGTGFTTSKNIYTDDPSLKPEYHIGDFDGDGQDDFLTIYKSTAPANNCNIHIFRDLSTDYPAATVIAAANIFDVGYYFTQSGNYSIDMNGNGKAELFAYDGTTDPPHCTSVYEYENGSINRISCYAGIPNHRILKFGDFNGDGKTDILAYTNGDFSVYISTGTSFVKKSITVFNDFLIDFGHNNFYVRDIDGDGKSDIIAIGQGNSTSNPVKFYVAYSDGQNFNIQTYSPSPSIIFPTYQQDECWHNFGDFNGDGTTDFQYDDGSIAEMFTFYRGRNQNMVSCITNGYNLRIGFNYKPLTDNSVYTKGTSSQYPIMDFQGSLYVVSSTWSDVAFNTPTDISNYNYNTARIHRMGKGFLGFQQVTLSNSLHNIQTIDQYEYNTTYFNVSLKQRNVNAVNGTPISQSVYTNSLLEFGDKRIMPYISQEVGTNYLSGIIKTSALTIDNNGNPLSTSETFDDGSYNTTTYSNYSSEGSWMPAKPQNVTVTKKHYSDAQSFSLSTTYTYQPNTGLVLTNITGPLTTTYKYNGNGNASQVTQSDGITNRTTRYEYDSEGMFAIKVYNAKDHLTQYTYDNATGNILTITSPNGQITNYTYDDFGRQIGISYPTGQSVTISYQWATGLRPVNAYYYKLTTSSGLPSVKEYYDAFGRILRTEKTGFDGTSIYSSKVYNAQGQVTQSSVPYYVGQQALAKSFSYDNFGRLVNVAGPLGVAAYTYSGKTTQVVTGAGHVSSKTIDSQGNVLSSTDEGGTITYTYKSLGKTGQISVNGTSTSMDYDAYGRQTLLTDPDAGATTYGYNGYNELISQTDAKSNASSMTYDLLGRLLTKTNSVGISTYSYDPAGNPGLLSSVTYPNGKETFGYDAYNRLTGNLKIIGTSAYVFRYQYDVQGRVVSTGYPSGFSTTNIYNTSGYLSEVRRTDNYALIWQGQNSDAYGHFTQYQYGNNLTTYKNYNNLGLLTGIQTGNVQNLNYNFDPGTGNLLSRSDGLRNLTETFTFDNLDRLTAINGPSPLIIAYDISGNITSKTGIGNYTYGIQPHAVSQVSNPQNIISTTTQNITYTPFNKVSTISEGSAVISYTYDWSNHRTISDFRTNTSFKSTIYMGNYEKEDNGTNTRHLCYIAGGDGLAAIFVSSNGYDTMYYIHTDHLGSYDVITDQNGTVVQNYSFDAWGRRRNPTNWTYTNMPAHSLFSRGFTGHEHLEAFNLINMNGRVYDPMLGRFLSPDNVIQDPFNTQSYNRYAYCLNNPLIYVDLNGYTWLGHFGNWVANNWKPILTTAVAVTASVAVIVLSAGTLTPFVAAVVAGAAGGLVNGVLGTALNGGSFGQCAMNGVLGTIMGGTLGAVGFGISSLAPPSVIWSAIYGALTGGTLGGLVNAAQGGSFWTGFALGSVFGGIGGGINGYFRGKVPSPNQVAEEAQEEVNASTSIVQAEEEAAGSDIEIVEEGSTQTSTAGTSNIPMGMPDNHSFSLTTSEPINSYSNEGKIITFERPTINGYNPSLASKTDLYHNFPKELDALIVQKGGWGFRVSDWQKYGNVGNWFESPGIIDGVKGVYQIGVNEQGIIFHKNFVPFKN